MKNKKTKKSRYKLISFLLVILTFQSCSPVWARNRSIKNFEKDQWKIVKVDKNEDSAWTIFSRKILGTTSIEYKIEGKINSTPDECLVAYRQYLYRHKSDNFKKKYPTFNITEENENSILTYVIHNEPFPLRDTEMSVRYLLNKNSDSSTGVKWTESWEDCSIPESKKLKRIEEFRGSWNFTPISEKSSQGAKVVRFDPKRMPVWLYEPMVLKFLKEGFNELKDFNFEK